MNSRIITFQIMLLCSMNGLLMSVHAVFGAQDRLGLSLYSLMVTQQENVAVLEWQTAAESRMIGFNLFRADGDSDSFQPLNTTLLPCLLDGQGGVYTYRDVSIHLDQRYTYRLDGIGMDGNIISTESVVFSGVETGLKMDPANKAEPIYVMAEHPMVPNRVLMRQTAAAAETQANALHRSTKTGDRLKIRVRDTGMYYLDTETIAQHFGVTINEVFDLVEQQMLRLSCQGEKCAWVPAPDKDGLFFYNEAIDSLYTDCNVFWLEKARGVVLPAVVQSVPEQSFNPMSRMKTFCLEEQLNTQINRFYNYLEDYWLWTYIYGGSGSTNAWFSMNSIDYSGTTATAEVVFCGGSNSGKTNEHHAVISINGTDVGESRWEQAVLHTGRYTFATSILSNGNNVLNMRGVLDTGVAYSLFFMDRFNITCLAHQQAVDNQYRIPPSTGSEICVSGFATSNLYIVQILNHAEIRLLDSFRTSTDGTGGYAVSFLSTNDTAGYAVFSRDGAFRPVEVSAVSGNSLRSGTNAVDFLLITHSDLYAETRRLEQFRAAQYPQLKTRTVLVDDLYDAFSYGIETPQAITYALKYAVAEWAVAPTYVLFAGEGCYDYKNYLGSCENLVPSVLTKTVDGIYSADNLMADITGNDAVPDFAIGRLPAATAAEMSNMVNKIIAYETAPGGAWTNNAVFVADNADSGGDFKQTCNNMAALFPAPYDISKIYLGEKTISVARSELLNAFNAGASFISYFGHGGWNRLASEGIMTITDMTKLTNSPRLPIVILETCTLNRYEVPGYDYFGEELLLTERHGAVASWGASGESLNSLAEHFYQFFMEGHFSHPEWLLGDAARQAAVRYRSMGYDRFESEIMTLLGDPMTTIR